MHVSHLQGSRARARRAACISDTGASAVEYALLVAAVAAVVAITVFAFGGLVLHMNEDNCATIRDSVAPAGSCS